MEKQIEDLKTIRVMKEKSSEFLSLSGLSGVMTGITAIVGAAFAYFFLLQDPANLGLNSIQEIGILLTDAIVVILVSIGFVLFFSLKKARKNKQKLFNNVSLRILYKLAVPMVTGGIFALIFLYRGDVEILASITLIFYGLALVNASKYTYYEIYSLGIVEIVLGLAAAIFLYYGIILWTIGFGICHIVYGLIIYKKYDSI
jgi:hypothetical protein